MSETIRLGHRLQFTDAEGNSDRKFQNWHVNENADGYVFLPFGFSGITVSLEGDNVNATLVFPIDGIARSWAQEAIEGQWIAEVEVSMFTTDKDQAPSPLYRYLGQVSSAGWDSTSIQLDLNTVLDAVGFDVPRRQLQQKLVGRLPTSGSISLR
jgi:hypothetical protein